jgi:hypothetical protein
MPYLPGASFYLRNKEGGGKNSEKDDVCAKERWFGDADCRAADFYWRIKKVLR